MHKSYLVRQEDLQDLFKLVFNNSEYKDSSQEEIALACYYIQSIKILQRVLGETWVEENLNPKGSFNRKSDLTWYKVPKEGKVSPLKIIALAGLVFNLCGKKGFEERVEKFKQQSIQSLYFELYAADSILDIYELEFVVESGEKEKDYEFTIRSETGEYNCEVKYIYDGSVLNSVEDRIKNASKQVPQDTMNILFLRMPSEFFSTKEKAEEINRVISNSSRRFGLVNTFLDQEEFLGEEGYATHTTFKGYYKGNAYLPIEKDIRFVKLQKDYQRQVIGGTNIPASFLEFNFN